MSHCKLKYMNLRQFDACIVIYEFLLPQGLMSIPSEGRLRVVIQPKPQSLLVGDALYLECGAVGKPLPCYQWYRNGAPLKKVTKRKLSVRDK